jgi:predicted nucleic acid-binding protein
MTKSPLVCVDASFVIRLLLGGPGGDKAEELWEEWAQGQVQAAAPGLIFYEITNALYRLGAGAYLAFEEITEILELALSLGINTISEDFLHRKAFVFAHQYGLKATYDAHYFALAQSLGADFWTADRRLVNAVTSKLSWVKSLVDS